MSGLVFIDDENNNVLDEWMNDTSSFVKGSSEVDIGEAVGGTGVSKGGLGFVETKASAKQKDAANKQKIANKAANKKRSSLTGDDDDELHGQVEHIEESRTSFKGKVEKQIDAVNKRKEEVQNKQNKKTKLNPNTVTKPAATQSTNTNKTTNTTNAINTETKPTSEVVNSTETAEERENSRKRKRTKTRSKQKNIRRDNRALENKPSHLQVGNKEYQGRQLTKETKTILGLTKAKK